MTNMTYAMRTSVSSEMKLLSMKDYMTRNIHCQGYHIHYPGIVCFQYKSTPILKQISDSNFYLKNTPTSLNFTPTSTLTSSWCWVAEVVRKHKGPSPKSLDLDKNFKYYHMIFCRDIRIHHNLRIILKTWGKKVIFGDKNSVSWASSTL